MAQGTRTNRTAPAQAKAAAEEEQAQATGTTSDSGAVVPAGTVQTADGAEHVGVLPASAATEQVLAEAVAATPQPGIPVEPAEVINALPAGGDHDRVAMLSLTVDGVPDQYDPEFITDAEHARAATRRQFTEQAVSAADAQIPAASSGITIVGTAEGEPDKVIPLTTDASRSEAAVQALHQKIVEAAVAAADDAVAKLTQGS